MYLISCREVHAHSLRILLLFGLLRLCHNFSPPFRSDPALYILYHLFNTLNGEHLHKVKA